VRIVANELVNWFNQVDATYRSDLKEMNELNFARFDAKVEQRFAQFEVRFAQFEAKMEQRFSQFEAKWEQRFAELRSDLAKERVDQIRWMFAGWVTLLIPIIGLWLR
jgi:hypothetical protein